MVLWVAGYFRDSKFRVEPPYSAAPLETLMAFHTHYPPPPPPPQQRGQALGHQHVISTGQAQERPGDLQLGGGGVCCQPCPSQSLSHA